MSGQTIARWKAWYTEDRVFEGTTFDEWESLPVDGVLSVILFHQDGTRRVMQGDELYFSTPEGVYAHDSRYSVDEVEKRYSGASVKRGKWTTDAEMERVAVEAMRAE